MSLCPACSAAPKHTPVWYARGAFMILQGHDWNAPRRTTRISLPTGQDMIFHDRVNLIFEFSPLFTEVVCDFCLAI